MRLWRFFICGVVGAGAESNSYGYGNSYAQFYSYSFGETTDCADEQDQSDYRGAVAETAAGVKCQYWTSQEPYAHDYSPDDYPDAGLKCHVEDGHSSIITPGNVVELSTLCHDVLRCPPSAWPSASPI